MVDSVKLSQAIAAVQRGMDVQQAAAKYGLELNELQGALNPKGGGKPEDGFSVKPDYVFRLKSGRKLEIFAEKIPDKYNFKLVDGNGAPTQFSVKTGGKNYTFRYKDVDGTPLTEEQFKKAEGVKGKRYVYNENGTIGLRKESPKDKFSDTKVVKYTGKRDGGYYIVYHRDSNTGKENFTYFNRDGKQITQDEYKRYVGYNGVPHVDINGMLSFYEDEGAFTDKNGDFSIAQTLKTLAGLVLSPVACGKLTDDMQPQIIDMGKTTVGSTVNVSVSVEQKTEIIKNYDEEHLATLLEYLKKIVESNGDLKAAIEKIMKEFGIKLDSIENALKIAIELLTSNNDLLKEVKDSINSGNADIMSALKTIQSSIEVLQVMIADMPNYKNDLNQIINLIKSGNTSIARLEDLISALIQKVVQNGDTERDILRILQDIKNGIGLNGEKLDSEGEKLAAMLELLASINAASQEIIDKLTHIEELLEAKFVGDSQAQESIKKALETLINLAVSSNTKAEVTNNFLNLIYNMLEKLGSDANANVAKILEAIAKNTDKLEDMNDLLQELGKQNERLQKEVLAYIANAGVDISNKLTAILKEAKYNNKNLEEIKQLIINLNALVAQNGEDAAKMGDQIIGLVAALGADTSSKLNVLIQLVMQGNMSMEDLKKLIEKLNASVEKNGRDAKEMGKEILDAINNLGANMVVNFETLIDAVNSGKADINDIKKLLVEINNAVVANGAEAKALGEKVMNFLTKFGYNTANALAEILAAINAGNAASGDIKALLEKVLANQEKIDANQNNNTAKILEALGNIKLEGGNVNIASLEAMLAELIKLTSNNNKLLSEIKGDTGALNARMDVLNATTKAILDKISTEFGKNDARYTNILNVLNAIKNKENEYDDTKLLEKLDKLANKLDDILKAIKDHKVTVTVEGKVTCECNCGNNGTHEGIIDTLEDILGLED